MNRTMKFMTNVEVSKFPDFAPINQFTHANKLADHIFIAVPKAKNDTFYSMAARYLTKVSTIYNFG